MLCSYCFSAKSKIMGVNGCCYNWQRSTLINPHLHFWDAYINLSVLTRKKCLNFESNSQMILSLMMCVFESMHKFQNSKFTFTFQHTAMQDVFCCDCVGLWWLYGGFRWFMVVCSEFPIVCFFHFTLHQTL